MSSRKIPELKPLFLERMRQLLDDESDFESYLEILKHEPVRSIRCNKLKINPKELKSRLEKNYDWKISLPWPKNPEVMIVDGKFINESEYKKLIEEKILDAEKMILEKSKDKILAPLSPGELGRSLEHLLGYYYIQELASMLPIIALAPKSGELILDLCASPGSKTTQIASEMMNEGTIIANEVSFGRIKILAANLERCGVSNVIITKKDGIALCKIFKKLNIQFDKILVDAPCSCEGTLRSSLKTYSMWNAKIIPSLSRLQKQLLESAFEILKPKGEIIYSTCTHAPEEDEEVVDFILEKYPREIKIEKISIPIKTREGIKKWEEKEYTDDVKSCCRVYPQDNNTEGFFLAKFKKIK